MLVGVTWQQRLQMTLDYDEGCVCNTLGNLLEFFFQQEIWKFAKTPGNFLAEFVCLLLLRVTVCVFQNVSVETAGSKPR